MAVTYHPVDYNLGVSTVGYNLVVTAVGYNLVVSTVGYNFHAPFRFRFSNWKR
jgi:hypothetical protein